MSDSPKGSNPLKAIFTVIIVFFAWMRVSRSPIALMLVAVAAVFALFGWRVGVGGLLMVLVAALAIIGPHWAVVGCAIVVVAFLLSVPLWALGWSRRVGRREVITLGCYSILAALSLVVFCHLEATRAYAALTYETNELRNVGRAIKLYSADYDGMLPPEQTWVSALNLYMQGRDKYTLPERLDSCITYGTPWEDSYQYHPPLPNSDYNHQPVINLTTWETNYGVQICVYASGRVQTRKVWPTWKYIWEGKLGFMGLCK